MVISNSLDLTLYMIPDGLMSCIQVNRIGPGISKGPGSGSSILPNVPGSLTVKKE